MIRSRSAEIGLRHTVWSFCKCCFLINLMIANSASPSKGIVISTPREFLIMLSSTVMLSKPFEGPL